MKEAEKLKLSGELTREKIEELKSKYKNQYLTKYKIQYIVYTSTLQCEKIKSPGRVATLCGGFFIFWIPERKIVVDRSARKVLS